LIFVTVGAQMPFDRLIREVDAWAAETGRQDVFAQIGETDYRPEHIEWTDFLDTDRFEAAFAAADVVVAHAGTGTILTALRAGRPLLVMPRRASLSETRNEHQLATGLRFEERGRVTLALDEKALRADLDRIEEIEAGEPIGEFAEAGLTDEIRRFILEQCR